MQRGEVHEGHLRLDDLLRTEDLREPEEAVVRDLHDREMALGPAGLSGIFDAPRDDIEERGLPTAGEAKEADFHRSSILLA